MVSMKDISIRCGVSVATVSKALNDHSDISDSTKRLVRNVAQEMGYFPNSSARALKTNRTFNLGVLFVDRARNGLTHDYFARVLDSFKVTAEARGYDLTFINCNKTTQRMTYLEHSRYRGVDGVVIAHVDFNQEEVAELIRSEIPVVTIDHSFDNKPSIVSDNIRGIRDMVEYIVGCGHKKIAYINGGDREVSSVTRNRIGSFYRTMSDLGLTIPEEYIVDADYRNPGKCYEASMKLLGMPDRPTCIMCPDDLSAIGCINAVNEKGLKVAKDISVAGYDGIDIARYLEPKICTIEQDTVSIGRKAAEKLIGMIEHPKTTLIERIVVEGKLLPGNSIAMLN
jgi:DNA-binding LacI/PurR family transcriptional regulator